MKRITLILVSAAVAAVGAALRRSSARAFLRRVGDIFDAAAGILGEVAGVATNSKGDIFVYTRTGNPNTTIGDARTFDHGGSRLFEFDQAGKFVREVGQGSTDAAAQQVRIDPQDNIWIVDAGSTQVVKFDPDGRVQMVLGRKPESINVRPGTGMSRALDAAAPPAAPAAGGGGVFFFAYLQQFAYLFARWRRRSSTAWTSSASAASRSRRTRSG